LGPTSEDKDLNSRNRKSEPRFGVPHEGRLPWGRAIPIIAVLSLLGWLIVFGVLSLVD